MARWDLPGVPHKGWTLVGFEDIKDDPDADYETCEMCGNERIRFVHILSHRKEDDPDHVSLHDVADEFKITVMKARKLLITGGLYSTAISRRVQELHAQDLTIAQITEKTGLKRASINSYLPYAHIIYNLPDISIKAERQKQYRCFPQVSFPIIAN